MENKTINMGVVAEIAKALKHLKEKMIFVGGAVVSLYTDDLSADEIRPTGDIDMTINLMNYSDWNKMQEELAQLGFYPDPFGHAICSYKYKNIPVDIMPAHDSPIGPANKWYQWGFDNLQKVKAKDEEIFILPAPCFLATKFAAFHDRGTDFRTSHDIEDIVYVLDNRINIVQEIAETHLEVRKFLQSELQKIIALDLLDDVLNAHIHPIMRDERLTLVQEKIRVILSF
jgi:predicted nucleotidyltransferase